MLNPVLTIHQHINYAFKLPGIAAGVCAARGSADEGSNCFTLVLCDRNYEFSWREWDALIDAVEALRKEAKC